ncbi:MAG: hypothetical protein ACJ74E_10375 [Actinomycetes bacterium]
MPAVEETKRGLTGVWRLLEYTDREKVEDPWTDTFGKNPCGVIGYHDGGLLHVQVYAQEPGLDWTHAGYIGRYSVREAHSIGGSIVGVLEHHMTVAFPVELLAEDPARPFTLKGDHLMLGDGETARRTLERVDARHTL